MVLRLFSVYAFALLLQAWGLNAVFGQSKSSVAEVHEQNRQRQASLRADWDTHPLTIRLKQYFEEVKGVSKIAGETSFDFGETQVVWDMYGFLKGKTADKTYIGFDFESGVLRYDLRFENGVLSTLDRAYDTQMSLWKPKTGTVFKATTSPAVLSSTFPNASIKHSIDFSLSSPPIQFVYWPYTLRWLQQIGEKGLVQFDKFDEVETGTYEVTFAAPFKFSLKFSDTPDGLAVHELKNEFVDVGYVNVKSNGAQLPQQITVKQLPNSGTFQCSYTYKSSLVSEIDWDLTPPNGTLVNDNVNGSNRVIGGGPIRLSNIDNMVSTVNSDKDLPIQQVELEKLKSPPGRRLLLIVACSVVALAALIWVSKTIHRRS